MRLSENWLREWVPGAGSTTDIVQQLTMAGLEVDAVHPVAERFEGVVVAEVVSVVAHPDSDHLHICEVRTGSDALLQIVCGAANVRAGLRAPLATVGALLGDGLRIKAAKLRGVASAGMLCSAQELGLADTRDGLLELPADCPLGANVWTVFGLSDNALELNITPNRGDCLSILGVARELALLTRSPLTLPVSSPPVCTAEERVPVNIVATAACPVYAGMVITGVNASAATPLVMVEKLRRSGIRSINPIVDVTNYVLLELGQPLHAFDLAKLRGGIQVRYAVAGEQLTLLDGQGVDLHDSTLVIADDRGPLAMAGVMGGADSGVSDETRTVFLESAFFLPAAIAGQARRYGLQTDSSYRFERGVDFDLQIRALQRAAELLLSIAGGAAGPMILRMSQEHLPVRPSIELRHERLQRVLGTLVPAEEANGILQGLQMQTVQGEGSYHVIAPTFRFDIEREEDLIEEIVRIRGYDSVPEDAPRAAMNFVAQKETVVPRSQLRQVLVDRGYQEAITYSFVDPDLLTLIEPDLPARRLLNPIAADMAAMRTSLWPGLLTALRHNLNRQISRVRLFETGLVFLPGTEMAQAGMLGGVVTGLAYPEQWGSVRRLADFFDLKADIEALLPNTQGSAFQFVPMQHPSLHPGQTTALLLAGERVGLLGKLHPRVADRVEVAHDTFVFQIRLDALEGRPLPHFAPLSKFPTVRRDLSLILDQAVTAQHLQDCIRATSGGDMITGLELFDVYEGKGLEPGKKSIAVGLTFQGSSSTLTEIDVALLVDDILLKLKQQVGAVVRS